MGKQFSYRQERRGTTFYTGCRFHTVFQLFALALAAPLHAQTWDLGGVLGDSIAAQTDNHLKLGIEQRERYENRADNNFGRDVDVATGLVRTRVSLTWQNTWMKVSGMMQDSRAPWYGPNAPNNVRDSADLHEAYVELFPEHKTGFFFAAGRKMLNYGEGRLIGTPQWGNTSRTYDHVRMAVSWRHARFEGLLVSPIKVQPDAFNTPVLGDRVWGVYSSFPELWRGGLVEAYVLRHDQNRPGGFTGGSRAAGTDRLGVNTFGFRIAGPAMAGWKYSIEAAVQNGRVAAADHIGSAWFSSMSRHWQAFGRPFDFSGEYKFASGSRNPNDPARSRTFDQLYAANHDKFGHEDLFGWRNLHDIRSLASYGVFRSLTVNAMYNNFWLASACDALYNGSGRSIVRSASCSAGSHVGQEADIFAVFKYRHFQVGAGYGYFLPGVFVRKTTPGLGPSYIYFFHSYTL